MGDDKQYSPTTEEKRFLDQESFITEAWRRRQLASGQKALWQRFLESPGGAAAASALLGGLFSLLVTLTVQRTTRDRDFQEAQLKARSEVSLLERKEHIEQQRELIKRAYELVGSTAAASDDLMRMIGPEFSTSNFSEEGVKKLLVQQQEVVLARYNKFAGEWANEKGKVRALLSYLNDEPEVVLSWQRVEANVDEYNKCVTAAYQRYASSYIENSRDHVCRQQKAAVWAEIDGLNRQLGKARQSSWLP